MSFKKEGLDIKTSWVKYSSYYRSDFTNYSFSNYDYFGSIMRDVGIYGGWAVAPDHPASLGYQQAGVDVAGQLIDHSYVPLIDYKIRATSSFVWYKGNYTGGASKNRFNVIITGAGGGGGPGGEYFPNWSFGGGGGGSGATLLAVGAYIQDGTTIVVGSGGAGGVRSTSWDRVDYSVGGAGGATEIMGGTVYRLTAGGGGGGYPFCQFTNGGGSIVKGEYNPHCAGGSAGTTSYGSSINSGALSTTNGGAGGKGPVDYLIGTDEASTSRGTGSYLSKTVMGENPALPITKIKIFSSWSYNEGADSTSRTAAGGRGTKMAVVGDKTYSYAKGGDGRIRVPPGNGSAGWGGFVEIRW